MNYEKVRSLDQFCFEKLETFTLSKLHIKEIKLN